MPVPRPCIVCGILTQGSRCPKHTRSKTWRDHRYVKAPNWDTLRNQVIQEERTCRRCGAPATTVDHARPKSQGGTDERRNLQALCKRCHDLKTQAESRISPRRGGPMR